MTISASLSLFLSRCMHTFQFLVCLRVQEKKNPSETRVSCTRVPLVWTLKKQSILSAWFACTSRGKKKIPSGPRVPLVWMLKKQSKQSAWNRAFTGWEKKNFPVELMFHRLEFHLEFQTLEFLSYIFFLNLALFFIFFLIFLHISFFLEDLKFQTLEFWC